MKEVRCKFCGKLLCKSTGDVEAKCPRCKNTAIYEYECLRTPPAYE